MSTVVVNSLADQYRKAFGLMTRFVDESSDAAWAGKSGGFPAWQQVYHSMECVYFFLGPVTPEERNLLYPMDVMLLRNVNAVLPAKPAIKALCIEANEYAEKFFAGLTDEDLGKNHEGFSSRINTPITNAGAISSLAGHIMYHLGYCDAVLRDNGQSTVF